jgi:transcriptional regulator with XRE-family HTH domain
MQFGQHPTVCRELAHSHSVLRKDALMRGNQLNAYVRAARAYADLKQPELAAKTGIGVETVKRIEAGTGGRVPSLEERQLIADACDVPRDFLDHGFPVESQTTPIERRLSTLEAQVRALREPPDTERRVG